MKLKYIYLLISAFFSTQTTSQNTIQQHITTFSITSPQLDYVKKIWVYLPTDYENSDKSYPVIYMHDAQNLFDAKTAYAGEWEVDEYMDNLTENKSIIIGIEHGNEKRIDELTPFKNLKYGEDKVMLI
ncbi:alpha/beta hydrolase-fold protein [Winogradskyella sp. PC D3.3]